METGGLIATFEALPDLAALETRWRAIDALAAPNFFTSWGWIGSWLRATGARPDLLSVRAADGREVGLALVGDAGERRLLGRVRTLRLNEAGDPAADRAFIEYNGAQCLSGAEGAVACAIADALVARRDWRALRLSGVEPQSPLFAALAMTRRVLIDRSPVHFVDLDAVRMAGGDYLSLLSASLRSQIRRSIKDYPAVPVVVRAPDAATAARWLEQMYACNAGRHADNAWEVPLFRAFVAELSEQPGVDLLRVEAADTVVGYLLNLCSGPVAMNYQSAFAPPLGARSKPGLMAHAAAVSHYAASGFARYSLLAGRDRYKESLATGAETLEWWSFERFDLRLETEYWLRRLLRR